MIPNCKTMAELWFEGSKNYVGFTYGHIYAITFHIVSSHLEKALVLEWVLSYRFHPFNEIFKLVSMWGGSHLHSIQCQPLESRLQTLGITFAAIEPNSSSLESCV
jgi:hypothetical protein